MLQTKSGHIVGARYDRLALKVGLCVDARCGTDMNALMQLLDSEGKPIAGGLPRVLTASFCRGVFFRAVDINEVVIEEGLQVMANREDLRRAQLPHLVTLLVYSSKFQLEPVRREYFVYAPPDIKSSVKLAMQLWKRWEKPRRAIDYLVTDMNEDFPKVEDACVSEVIDDKFFDEMWKNVSAKAHKAAGHPADPFAFTSLDPDIMVYKFTDFQKGLAVTV